MKQRGPIFISARATPSSQTPLDADSTFVVVTNFTLSFGTPFACILYLIVFEAAGGLNANLSTVWRTTFGISCLPPLAVFYFRLKMLNSKLYRKVSSCWARAMSPMCAKRLAKQGAIQHNVPYALTLRFYWKSLIGTAGAW